jgi:hypothetical protein
MPPTDLEIALRRLTDQLGTRSQTQATGAAAGVASEAASAAGAEVDTHAALRQFVHGVGPLFVAKTKNPDQFVDWTEVKNKPSSFPGAGGIDPTTLELAGAQITTGTVNINRLPVANDGAADHLKLVRSDDPRLTSRAFILSAATPVYRGRFVTANGDGVCAHASAAGPGSAAVGFVADDYGTGAAATIYRDGDVEVFLPDQGATALMGPVFLASDGRVSRTMPLAIVGGVVQQLGVIVALTSSGRVRIAVTIGDAEEVC